MDGSSPLVRGTAEKITIRELVNRFIPARAGNRQSRPRQKRHTAVHPRSCGEQSVAGITSTGTFGSSPLVRGTVNQLHGHAAHVRFIPARAGNSPPCAFLQAAAAVHPRSCGEQHAPDGNSVFDAGSSPLVRGTAESSRIWSQDVRFIPARAGNRSGGIIQVALFTVHPRSCGEQTALMSHLTVNCGSSPLVRGTEAMIKLHILSIRFIPARAGNRLLLLTQNH